MNTNETNLLEALKLINAIERELVNLPDDIRQRACAYSAALTRIGQQARAAIAAVEVAQ
jgi:hypothetical protein